MKIYIMYVQEVLTHFMYVVNYYIKELKTSGTYCTDVYLSEYLSGKPFPLNLRF